MIGHPISSTDVLASLEEPEEVVAKKIGRFIEVQSYRKAIELSNGCVLWSDRSGTYVFSKEPPGVVFVQMQTLPFGIRFEYNRLGKKIRVFNGSRLIAEEDAI